MGTPDNHPAFQRGIISLLDTEFAATDDELAAAAATPPPAAAAEAAANNDAAATSAAAANGGALAGNWVVANEDFYKRYPISSPANIAYLYYDMV